LLPALATYLVSIYGVYEPGWPGLLFVIGRTSQPLKVRLYGYIYDPRHKIKHGETLSVTDRWILNLLQRGLRPEILLLETCPLTEWKARERFHIARWKRINPRLCNRLPGGEGPEPGGTRLKLVCEKCGRARTRGANGGHQLGCAFCLGFYHKEWCRNNKAKRNTTAKRRYHTNPEKFREQDRRKKQELRLRNPEEYRAKRRALTTSPEFRVWRRAYDKRRRKAISRQSTCPLPCNL